MLHDGAEDQRRNYLIWDEDEELVRELFVCLTKIPKYDSGDDEEGETLLPELCRVDIVNFNFQTWQVDYSKTPDTPHII